jgi:hypothetical protein
MGTHGVVVPSPGIDHNLGLVERVEDLPVEQFGTQFTSVSPIVRIASTTAWPWAVSTSICRSFETISSAVCLFLPISISSSVKIILQGEPLQRGQIRLRLLFSCVSVPSAGPDTCIVARCEERVGAGLEMPLRRQAGIEHAAKFRRVSLPGSISPPQATSMRPITRSGCSDDTVPETRLPKFSPSIKSCRTSSNPRPSKRRSSNRSGCC